MRSEDETVLLIRGAIASLPAAQAEAVNELAEHLRQLVKAAGDIGPIALGLVGAEFAAQGE